VLFCFSISVCHLLSFVDCQELHSAAENAVKNYTFDETLMLSQVDYVNVNDMADLVNLTEYSDHFKQNIYAESSGVQIPIEIYEGCEYIFPYCFLSAGGGDS